MMKKYQYALILTAASLMLTQCSPAPGLTTDEGNCTNTTVYKDGDGDGFGDDNDTKTICLKLSEEAPAGYSLKKGDCEPTDKSVFPSGGKCEAAPCKDITVYKDSDGDGFGVDTETKQVCLTSTQQEPGYVRKAGDCAPDDILKHPQASGICSDRVDDDCDGQDESCPESMPSQIQEPDWDCMTGNPPSNIVAYALFNDGKTYYKSNACFIIFEGSKDQFYVKPVNLDPQDPNCFNKDIKPDGCICPTPDKSAYDQRLYAYTLEGQADACPIITLEGSAMPNQIISNHCRGFVAPLYDSGEDYFFMSGSYEYLETRISNQPTLEIACAYAPDCDGADWKSLLTANIKRNDSFEKMQ